MGKEFGIITGIFKEQNDVRIEYRRRGVMEQIERGRSRPLTTISAVPSATPAPPEPTPQPLSVLVPPDQVTVSEMPTMPFFPCSGFSKMTPIIIDHTQVPADQTNFPLLISITSDRLKSTAHGGPVQSASGFDIRPKLDSVSCTEMTYELEDGGYDPVTGTVLMWVLLPTISSSSDTQFFLAYGNPALTTDGSNDDVWTGYTAVLHQNVIGAGSAGTRNSASLPATANNVWGNENTTTTSAEIGNGGSFDGSTTSLNGNATAETDPFFANILFGTTDCTVSAWVRTSSGNYQAIGARKNSLICAFGNAGSYWEFGSNNGKPFWILRDTGSPRTTQSVTANTVIADNAFHYVVGTRVGAVVKIYIDAVLDVTDTGSGTIDLVNDGGTHYVGRTSSNTCLNRWNGVIDEFRTHKTVARDANWIQTEYNNQSSPSTFYTLGSEIG